MQKENVHQETHFEQYITRKLKDLGDKGWQVSDNDTGFNPSTALVLDDFITYLERTVPDKVESMKSNPNWRGEVELRLVRDLEKYGTFDIIRNGFKWAGYGTIVCSGHYPDDPRYPQGKVFYEENILRVMRQVHYQTAGRNSLDLVFFINGIPIATAEIKTELTQTVEDAIEEYQKNRRPIEPLSKRKNYLLMYKRGAIVHFAMSEDEIYMCTDLTPQKARFLPFNKGNDGHAGNPPMEADSEDYPIAYFWDAICEKSNWLRIFHNFIFEKTETEEDITGKQIDVKKLIFPRYHQWDCVVKSISHVQEHGVGQRYLIEHSAGSGKTETITWIAHELNKMRKPNGDYKFSSIIVITDRLNLDSNIKNTIGQLDKTPGLIQKIGGDDIKKSSRSKSKDLADAILNKARIIVVTIQTFPFAMDAILNDNRINDADFAVLIDEAHNSQEGTLSKKTKETLGRKSRKKTADDDGLKTDEDIVNDYFQKKQSSHTMPENVSFFAFTATPKAKTMTLFGSVDNDHIDPKTAQPIPHSFHLYPMRQAIEEGYIIDVLRGYMPYETAYKLSQELVTDKMVDATKARRTIAEWASFHPVNVMSKAQFILEHFMKNVSSLMNFQAKAMIVTRSRASVVRYKFAMDAYIKAHPEMDASKVASHLQFKVPGEPLVAFSDTISGADCVMDEVDYVNKTNPFALIKKDYNYSEININDIGNFSIEREFNKPERRLLIVADKFQTGFNQPKLCAMYIDKPISNDIEIVQTYSRVNRVAKGKDTVYIIDFVNEPDKVLKAFRKYDKGAEMEHAQRLEIVYEIKSDLDKAGIYTNIDFEQYKKAKVKSILTFEDEKSRDSFRNLLYKSIAKPANEWNSAMKAQRNALYTWSDAEANAKAKGDSKLEKKAQEEIKKIQTEIERLNTFKLNLQRYISAYNFISQIVYLGEPDLEAFSGFAKLLFHRLKGEGVEDIDIGGLALSDYRINKVDFVINEDAEATKLKPMRAGGKAHTRKQESLKKIISNLNEIFPDDKTETTTKARAVNAFKDVVEEDATTRIQIRNSSNSKEAIINNGKMEAVVKAAAMKLKKGDIEALANQILTDPQAWKPLASLLYDLINEGKPLDIPNIADSTKKK